jgi:hypothetical protein
MAQNHTPPAALSARCAAVIRANGDLLSEVLPGQPELKAQLDRLLAAGWRVGTDSLCNARGELAIAIVAVAPGGERLVLATIPGPTLGPASH